MDVPVETYKALLPKDLFHINCHPEGPGRISHGSLDGYFRMQIPVDYYLTTGAVMSFNGYLNDFSVTITSHGEITHGTTQVSLYKYKDGIQTYEDHATLGKEFEWPVPPEITA